MEINWLFRLQWAFSLLIIVGICDVCKILVVAFDNQEIICSNTTITERPSVIVLRFSLANNSSPDNIYENSISLELVCNSSLPIEWTFAVHPNTDSWNVTYRRETDNLHNISNFHFSSVLRFWDLPLNLIMHSAPVCRQVYNHCSSTGVNITINEGKVNITPDYTLLKTERIALTSASYEPPLCSLSFNYNWERGEFYCSLFNSSVSPKISLHTCANPTECGVYIEKQNCWSLPEQNSRQCDIDDNCSLVKANTTFSHGIAICNVENVAFPTELQIQTREYFYSNFYGSNTNTGIFYSTWKEIAYGTKLHTQVESNEGEYSMKTGETFNISCFGPYYILAQGFHATIKISSEESKKESNSREIEIKNSKLYAHTVSETVVYSSWEIPQPVIRRLDVHNLLLTAGEYEVTCYAPMWNSTSWVTKSEFLSVMEPSVPVFLDGNREKKIDFEPSQNITCVAKGQPVPKIEWRTQEIVENELNMGNVDQIFGKDKTHSWAILTLPETMSDIYKNYVCHAENSVGHIEKHYHIQREDVSAEITMKIAAIVVVIGFSLNLVVLYLVYKYICAKGKIHIPCL